MFYSFGEYQLDLENLKLFRKNELVSDDDKTIKALKLLCQNYPEAVDKQIMLDELWPGQVVTEWSLSKLVSDIRQLLGDTGKDQGHIKTIRGKGFKLNMAVKEVDSLAEALTAPDNSGSKSQLPKVLGAMTILALAGLMGLYFFQPQDKPTSADYPLRIAVLPVISETGESMDDWVKYGVMSIASRHLDQYHSLQTIPMEKVISTAAGLSNDLTQYSDTAKLFKSVCGQLGCSHLVSIKYRLENKVPILNYQIVTEGSRSPITEFANRDVIDTADMMLDHLASELIPAEMDVIPLEQNFSRDNKVNRDYAIGVHELYNGNLQSARDYLKLALNRESNFFWAKAHLAEVEYRAGNLSESGEMIEQLQSEKLDAAKSYFLQHLLSNILYSQGKLEESLAATIELTKNPYVISDPFLMGNQRLNIGSSLQALGKNREAIPELEMARASYKKAGFGSGEGKVLFNLANVFLTSSDTEKALSHYHQAREVFIRYGLEGYALMAKHQIATTNLYNGKIQNVEGELRLLIDAYKKIGDREGEMTAKLDLSNVSIAKRDYKEAAERIERLLVELESTEFSYLKNHALRIAVRSNLQSGNLERAESLYSSIKDQWNDVRVDFALIPAHLKHDKGELKEAVELGYEIKKNIGEQWTENHQLILDKIEASYKKGEPIPLDY